MTFTQQDFENVLRSMGDITPGMSPPFPWPTIPCPDEVLSFGSLEVQDWSSAQRRTSQRAVIVVIESPHEKEFTFSTDNDWQANGPLQRRTSFLNHFKARVGNASGVSPDGFVFLINAVRFQCSLGKAMQGKEKVHRQNSKDRDARFRQCWENGADQDFIERITDIYRDDDVIVNACTGTQFGVRRRNGGPPDDLKWMVENAIMTALPNHRPPVAYRRGKKERLLVSDIGTYHPCKWLGNDREAIWPRSS
ncbi:hypothetical protein VH569_34095 [Azospirillum sp. 11R-A]|uniref:hypothetical protein n=1 Tax=Azospirillum sp. 11R-A TaxID=3111634 RepID=UPI003C159F7C